MRGKYEYLHLTGKAREMADAFLARYEQFLKERAEFVRSISTGEAFCIGPDGEVRAVSFKEAPGKPWKASRRWSGYWVPDRRYKPGKELAAKFNRFRKPHPIELFEMMEACGFESSNIQPLESRSGNGALIVGGTLHLVAGEVYLLMPHRQHNEERKRKRPTPQPLPAGVTLLHEWQYLKAVQEAEVREAGAGAAKKPRRKKKAG